MRREITGVTQVDEKGHQGNTAAVTAYIYIQGGFASGRVVDEKGHQGNIAAVTAYIYKGASPAAG